MCLVTPSLSATKMLFSVPVFDFKEWDSYGAGQLNVGLWYNVHSFFCHYRLLQEEKSFVIQILDL